MLTHLPANQTSGLSVAALNEIIDVYYVNVAPQGQRSAAGVSHLVLASSRTFAGCRAGSDLLGMLGVA